MAQPGRLKLPAAPARLTGPPRFAGVPARRPGPAAPAPTPGATPTPGAPDAGRPHTRNTHTRNTHAGRRPRNAAPRHTQPSGTPTWVDDGLGREGRKARRRQHGGGKQEGANSHDDDPWRSRPDAGSEGYPASTPRPLQGRTRDNAVTNLQRVTDQLSRSFSKWIKAGEALVIRPPWPMSSRSLITACRSVKPSGARRCTSQDEVGGQGRGWPGSAWPWAAAAPPHRPRALRRCRPRAPGAAPIAAHREWPGRRCWSRSGTSGAPHRPAGDAPIGPVVQRIAIHHRVFQHALGAADQARHIERPSSSS